MTEEPAPPPAPPAQASTHGFQYPFAAAPDIIRSNQKDVYFQAVLLDRFSTVLRSLYGARFIHRYTSEARTFAELLYLACTTFIGNRTLGEEYCDIVQMESDTFRLPTLFRRVGYVLSSVLLPYILNRLLPSFRTRLRLRLESNLRQAPDGKGVRKVALSGRIQSYVLRNLSTLTSPSPFYAIALSIFYFNGAYYHVGKRTFGLRYFFTKRLEPSDQRVGYEVLGVLLVLQMAVQGWLHIHSTVAGGPPTLANASSLTGGSAVIDGGVEMGLGPPDTEEILFESARPSHTVGKSSIEKNTHTPVLSGPRYVLSNMDTFGWIQTPQQRRCTLCLEELKDPSATTCGHVFCWTCIQDWIREKAECPLCRQSIMAQHVLPLRG